MTFLDADELPSTCERGEIAQFSFRNDVFSLGGGGMGTAFKCLKEGMEKATSRSLMVWGSVVSNY